MTKSRTRSGLGVLARLFPLAVCALFAYLAGVADGSGDQIVAPVCKAIAIVAAGAALVVTATDYDERMEAVVTARRREAENRRHRERLRRDVVCSAPWGTPVTPMVPDAGPPGGENPPLRPGGPTHYDVTEVMTR